LHDSFRKFGNKLFRLLLGRYNCLRIVHQTGHDDETLQSVWSFWLPPRHNLGAKSQSHTKNIRKRSPIVHADLPISGPAPLPPPGSRSANPGTFKSLSEASYWLAICNRRTVKFGVGEPHFSLTSRSKH
jgi:hypothetical protein